MLHTHRQVATHHGAAIHQRQPGFEYTPIMLAKVASYLVQAPDGSLTVFAFLYSLLEGVGGAVVDEAGLLAQAVAVIGQELDAGIGSGEDHTYEYHGGRFVAVEQPRWWIPTRP